MRRSAGTVAPCVQGTCRLAAASCAALKAGSPGLGDGVYAIDPDGAGPAAALSVWCDMTTDGGGWTLLATLRSTNTGEDATCAWAPAPPTSRCSRQ